MANFDMSFYFFPPQLPEMCASSPDIALFYDFHAVTFSVTLSANFHTKGYFIPTTFNMNTYIGITTRFIRN